LNFLGNQLLLPTKIQHQLQNFEDGDGAHHEEFDDFVQQRRPQHGG